MTWAQGTFAFCFGIVVPAVGVLCAARLKRERKPWFKGLILGSGATFLGLLGCCFIAVLCYPHYPTRQRPPELLANAFALPGVAAGIAAVWFVSDARSISRRFSIFASALVLLLYLGGLAVCYHTRLLGPFARLCHGRHEMSTSGMRRIHSCPTTPTTSKPGSPRSSFVITLLGLA